MGLPGALPGGWLLQGSDEVDEVKEHEDAQCEHRGIVRGVQRKRQGSRGNRRSNRVGLNRPKYRLPIVAE